MSKCVMRLPQNMAHGAKMRDICNSFKSSRHLSVTACPINKMRDICKLLKYSRYLARRAGVPSGEARRVILRDLKFGSNWKPKNRFKNVVAAVNGQPRHGGGARGAGVKARKLKVTNVSTIWPVSPSDASKLKILS